MSAPTTKRSMWRAPAMLILMSAMPLVGGIARLAEIAAGEVTPANARFLTMPVPILIHIFTALPFLILGAFQFVPALRGRSRWHRYAGRALAPLGLAAALSGLWMTWFYPWAEGDGAAVYLFRLFFGWAMLVSIAMGLVAVWRRDFSVHGEWMLRGYAIGMGAGTQVLTHIPVFILMETPAGVPRAVAMGAGWVINVIVAEWIIARRGRAFGLVSRAPA